MSERVKPLQVSPVIKISRYLSLVCGIMYGAMKLNAIRAYEVTAKPRREKLFEEKAIRKRIESTQTTRKEMVKLVEEMGLPDVTPGWELNIE